MRVRVPINDILNEKITRKEFIKRIGFAMMAMSGATAAMRTLTGIQPKPKSRPQDGGYGDSAYGGKKSPEPRSNRRSIT